MIVHAVASVINGLSTSTAGYVFRIVVSYIAMHAKAFHDNDGREMRNLNYSLLLSASDLNSWNCT